jgi:hypothetical protein
VSYVLFTEVQLLGENQDLHYAIYKSKLGGFGVFWFGDSDPEKFYITKRI